jgi:hypothetical protein
MKRPTAINWLRQTLTWYFSAKVVLAVLVLAVSGATITVSTTNYQAELGSAYNAKNNILVRDKGFFKASAATTATGSCPTATTFGPVASNANNNIIAGDIVYGVQLNATATTPLFTCFTVTLTFSSGGSQTVTTLQIASTSSILADQTIDCKLDTGMTSLPSSPFSFTLTVQ